MALSRNARAARREFVDLYGSEQRDVVSLIARGWTSNHISEKTGVPLESVAATRANVTRGSYEPFVYGSVRNGFQGTCRF